MISRTSAIAAIFALLATASLAGAAELHAHNLGGATAKSQFTATVQLPTVVVTGKRIVAQS